MRITILFAIMAVANLGIQLFGYVIRGNSTASAIVLGLGIVSVAAMVLTP